MQESQVRASIEQLSHAVQSTNALIQTFLKELRDNSVAMASFATQLSSLQDHVDTLSRILRDGNGDSLIAKVSVLENSIRTIEKEMDRGSTVIEKLRDDTQRYELDEKKDTGRAVQEKRNMRLQFWGTIIASVLALAGSIVAMSQK